MRQVLPEQLSEMPCGVSSPPPLRRCRVGEHGDEGTQAIEKLVFRFELIAERFHIFSGHFGGNFQACGVIWELFWKHLERNVKVLRKLVLGTLGA